MNELNQLKNQLNQLQGDVEFLKENFQSFGYSKEDTLVTDEELQEVQRIKGLVNAGNLEEFEELK
jgi:prefoldin subunit 5